jgi:hypothetical protein
MNRRGGSRNICEGGCMYMTLNFFIEIIFIHVTLKYFILDKDGPCLQKHGLCGPTYLPCKGSYSKGLCNGYPERQCCIPHKKAPIKKLLTSPSAPIGKLNQWMLCNEYVQYHVKYLNISSRKFLKWKFKYLLWRRCELLWEFYAVTSNREKIRRYLLHYTLNM